jgi:vacuolar-type H+-ATPase subunit I/STV1
MSLLDDIIKKHSSNPTAAIKTVREKLDKLRRERDAIREAPMCREDLEVWLLGMVDAEAELYPIMLQNTYRRLIADHPLELPSIGERTQGQWNSPRMVYPSSHPAYTGGDSPKQLVNGVQSFLCFAFKDQVKKAISDAISEWDFTDAGLPRVEREKKLAQLDKQIAAAEKEYNEIKEDIRKLTNELNQVG